MIFPLESKLTIFFLVDGYRPFDIANAVKIIQTYTDRYPKSCQEIIHNLIGCTEFKYQEGEYAHQLSEYSERKFWMEEYAIPLLELWKVASLELQTDERKKDLLNMVKVCEEKDRLMLRALNAKQQAPLNLETELTIFAREFKKRQNKIKMDNDRNQMVYKERNEAGAVTLAIMNKMAKELK